MISQRISPEHPFPLVSDTFVAPFGFILAPHGHQIAQTCGTVSVSVFGTSSKGGSVRHKSLYPPPRDGIGEITLTHHFEGNPFLKEPSAGHSGGRLGLKAWCLQLWARSLTISSKHKGGYYIYNSLEGRPPSISWAYFL